MDNKFWMYGCPPQNTYAGTLFTNYSSPHEMDKNIAQSIGVTNSNQYREYLQNNGEQMIKQNLQRFEHTFGKCTFPQNSSCGTTKEWN